MMKKILVFALSIMVALGSFSIPALAQASSGSLVGTVSSADGVVVGATVVVTDNQTGKERKTITSDEGTFSVPQLDFGAYTLKVTAQGFKSFTATDVKIDVGQQYSLNVVLEVGAITENVTVSAGADLVHATSAELSNTVSARQIQELPLNGRNPLGLVALQAGTSSNGAQNTVINGQQSSFTNITRDGINVQDNFIRSNAVDFIPDRPNVDDTSEFTIVTQNAGAELGYGASQIQLVTPRGSNKFHGAGYLYNRNSEFAANDFFRNAAGRNAQGNPVLARPFLNRNQFGGRIGGPILKEKLFFFGAYEAFRLRQSQANPTNRTVLLPQARQGIFTYTDTAGARRTVNVLQLAGLSADPTVASRILANVPESNSTIVGDQLNTSGFTLSRKSDQDRDAYTSRIDYEINQNNSISGTYSYRKENLMRPDVDNGGYLAVPFGTQDAHTKFFAGAYRRSFSSSFTNEVRGGFQTSNPFFRSSGENVDYFLAIPLISNPESSFRSQGRDTGIYNIQDNAVLSRGQHAIKFGGQAQWFRVKSNNFAGNLPTFTLGTNINTPQLAAGQFPGGISAAQRGTANSLLALLAGIVGSGNQSLNVTSKDSGFVPKATTLRKLTYDQFSLYVADQWRVRPDLTFNLGLRYELFTALKNPDRLALEPVIPDGKSVIDTILDPNGRTDFVGTNVGGNKFFKNDKNNFAPIVSMAYSPNLGSKFLKRIFPDGGRTVIRAGYRMSYVNDEFVRGADNALSGNPGLTATANAINPATGTSAINARLNALPSLTIPAFTGGRTFAQNNALSGNFFGTVFAVDPNLQVPRTHEYNVSFEREIGFQTAIEIRYVGGRSDNLLRGIDLNQVEIRSNGFVDDFVRARSNLAKFGNPACANPATGCQALTVFPKLGGGGVLTDSGVRGMIQSGFAADLAILYITNGLSGTVPFLANPNAGPVDLLGNFTNYRYNSLQAEIRKRFSHGLYFQANYTYQKTLTDGSDAATGQTNFTGRIDNAAPKLEYARASFDTAHVFNLNTIYELPFGQGKRFFSGSNGVFDRIIGGWQLTSIVRVSTGAPIYITDTDGTLNRAGRSGNQTAFSNLTNGQIKDLAGVFKTPCGIYYINPSAIHLNLNQCTGTGAGTGRGSDGLDTTFAGQVFFDNQPGQTGNVERASFDGPNFFNIDASVIKNIRIKESVKVQLRAEAFNLFNRANFFAGQSQSINSTSFFKITSTFGPRIVQFVGRVEF